MYLFILCKSFVYCHLTIYVVINVIFQKNLQKEKQRTENANNANVKLLHECGILRNRLQECSVNFLIEEEDKLIVDTSSPSDAIDLLTTSDNRIGLLLAEVSFTLLVLLCLSSGTCILTFYLLLYAINWPGEPVLGVWFSVLI